MANVILGGDEIGAGDANGPAPPTAGDWRQVADEQRLLQAILEQAILDYCGREGAAQADAGAWFQSAGTGLHSFRWVCQLLDLDPDYVWEHRADWKVERREGGGLRGKQMQLLRREAA